MGNQCCTGKEFEDQKPFVKFQTSKAEEISTSPVLEDPILQFLMTVNPFKSQLQADSFNKKLLKMDNEIYEGPVDRNNQPNGFAKIYRTDGSLLIGQFRSGEIVGQCYLVKPDGTYFYGFTNNLIIDRGIYVEKGFTYQGKFQHCLFHGEGRETCDDYEFVGQYNQGKRVNGELKWRAQNFQHIYKGDFNQSSLFQGNGVLTEREGVYKGQFKRGFKQGQGEYEFKNGMIYRGYYKGGVKSGQGILLNCDGTTCYKGNFQNGLPHGDGVAINDKQVQVRTQFHEGIPIQHHQKLKRSQIVEH